MFGEPTTDRVRTEAEKLDAGFLYATMYAVECGAPRPVDANIGWAVLTIEADRTAMYDGRSYDEVLDSIIEDIEQYRGL